MEPGRAHPRRAVYSAIIRNVQMTIRYFAALLASCSSFSFAASPVVVAKDGSGDFPTVQAAVDAAPSTGAIIRIRPGTYEEKITIDKPKIHLLGLGADPKEVVLSFNLNAAAAGGTFKSASTTVTG